MTEQPFEVLQLPPTASAEEAVRQAARLTQLAPDEATRNRIRQAIQQVMASPQAWTLAALLAHPRPQYERPEGERFVAQHRRPPAGLAALPLPEVDWDEFRALRLDWLESRQPVPVLPLEPLGESGTAGEQTAWPRLVDQPGA
jgi:hypothetical protein